MGGRGTQFVFPWGDEMAMTIAFAPDPSGYQGRPNASQGPFKPLAWDKVVHSTAPPTPRPSRGIKASSRQ